MIHDPQQQTQNHTQQNASYQRKMKTAIPPLIRNISGQSPKPERQLSNKRQQRPHANQHESHYNEKLPGLTQWVHNSALSAPF
jgi:hypothetical protein